MGLTINRHPSLAERTTLGFGGHALAEADVRTVTALPELAKYLKKEGGTPFAMGKGSNILAKDGDVDLIIIRAGSPDGPEIVSERDGKVLVSVGARAMLPSLISFTKQGFSGLEGLVGIPGSVGGAVAMNAGSWGMEMADRVNKVRIWTPEKGLFWMDIEDCDTGYRHFNPGIKGLYVIWEIEMTLDRDDPGKVEALITENMEKKMASQPITAKSAGCVFKNPEGHSAGKLLEEAGFRGKSLGGAAFSEMHANFLINLGDGTATQALELMESARNAVKEKFDILLENEVTIIP